MTTKRYFVVEQTDSSSSYSEWSGGSEPKISARFETLTEREAAELPRSNRYVGHAPEFPTALWEPLETETGSAGSTVHDSTPAWGLKAIGVEEDGYRGNDVSVAVLDTGIDVDHPAFATMGSRIRCTDYLGRGDGHDENGHGTHCCGVFFGQEVDGRRLSVAPGIRVAFVGKVLDGKGRGNSLALFKAMMDAIQAGVSVVSMSLGFDFPRVIRTRIERGVTLELAAAEAIRDVLANIRVFDSLVNLGKTMTPHTGGTLFVAAAGNHSTPEFKVPPSPPASAQDIIAVGAAQLGIHRWRVASFSNTAPTLCAPGVGIISAYPCKKSTRLNVKPLSGTSMAAPHVAGAAALWFEALKERGEQASSEAVRVELLSRASKDFDPDVPPADRGHGLVQVPHR